MLQKDKAFSDVMSGNETARYLKLSGPTLRKLMRDDPTFPHRRAGARVLVSRAALDAWLSGKGER